MSLGSSALALLAHAMRSIGVTRPLTMTIPLDHIILRNPTLVYRSLHIAFAEGRHAALMHFEGSKAALEALRAEYVASPPGTIHRIEIVHQGARSLVVYKVERSSSGPADIAGLVYSCFGPECIARSSKDSSGARWDVITFSTESVTTFLDSLRAMGGDVQAGPVTEWQLSRFTTAGDLMPLGDLTAREDQTVRRAHDLGYFDSPRRADVSDVAKALDIPRSTVHLHLKRATAKIVKRALGAF